MFPHGRQRPPETHWETSNQGRVSWKQFHNGIVLARRHRTPRQSRFHGAVNTRSRCALPPPITVIANYSFLDSQVTPLRHRLPFLPPSSRLIYRIYHTYITRIALSTQDGDPFQVRPFLNPCGILGVVKTCFIRPISPHCSADFAISDPSRPFDK